MRVHALGLTAIQLGLWLTIAACGASSPQPNTAESAPASSASAATASSSAAAKPGAAAKTAEPPAAPEEPAKTGPSPQEVLSREGVLYSIAFEDSDVGKKAVEACAKDSGGDPKKRAACMAKAHEKLDFDGVQFTRDKEGVWWYVMIRKKGTTLRSVHKVRFQFGEETGNTIAILTEGKDMGSAAGKVPAKVVFEVPSDFRISNVDPKYGKLFYEAKMIGTGSN